MGELTLAPIPGGANNRVFRVLVPGASFLLKAYFRHESDQRDRLGAEFGFSRFAWDHGLRCLPEPVARDEENNLGLYEFIEGRKLGAGEVNAQAINQSLDFYIELNQYRDDPEAGSLPKASESCFSILDHLQLVKRRIERLRKIHPKSDVDREAMRFVADELSPMWNQMEAMALKESEQQGLRPGNEIKRDERCISPSDFGFHNALLTSDGRLKFIDFEYAGWDDPAKLACDFFCQPEVPVPLEYFEKFSKQVASLTPSLETHIQRMRILLPVYQVKWVCIMLNEFLSSGQARRSFAQAGAEIRDGKAVQLGKAGKAFERIRPEPFC
jgi:thiamine kinase-like enzyme